MVLTFIFLEKKFISQEEYNMTDWQGTVDEYEKYLREREMSENTVEKYLRDVWALIKFAGNDEITRETVIAFKQSLIEKYRVTSLNSMLAAVNGFLKWMGREELCVRICRTQKQIFRDEKRELTREEYYRLLRAAKAEKKDRLNCLLQAVAGTGMRIGELKYLTVETLKKRQVRIDFKGKIRVILLPSSLCSVLRDYCRRKQIRSGCIFCTGTGRPLDRKNIWAEMKKLCKRAKVEASKVFPHNLRHLFAKCFYEREKDLARLADYLGHSSIETTRRYTMITSEEACARQLELELTEAKIEI